MVWLLGEREDLPTRVAMEASSPGEVVESVRTLSPEIAATGKGPSRTVAGGGRRTEFPESDSRDEAGALIQPPGFADEIFPSEGEGEDFREWSAMRDRIEEAMVTYSEEGLAVLAPMLSHPNARVRAEAADAITQMDVPGGAAVLREAAAKATSAAERRRLEEAADFCDLPTISAEDLRQLVLRTANESGSSGGR